MPFQMGKPGKTNKPRCSFNLVSIKIMSNLIVSCSADTRKGIYKELRGIGCCSLCCLRYLGLIEPYLFRNATLDLKETLPTIFEDKSFIDVQNSEGGPGQLDRDTICIACLGLLQFGIQEEFLSKITEEVKKSDIEACSYTPAFFLPHSILLRAYAIWYHLEKKFPDVYSNSSRKRNIKPEVVSLKNVWKWIANGILKNKINPNSDWSSDGALIIDIHMNYQLEAEESSALIELKPKESKSKQKQRKRKWNGDKRGEDPGESDPMLSKIAVDSILSSASAEDFIQSVQCPPPIPQLGLEFCKVECSHLSIYVAGRYCKFSRELSQTPWLIDGERKTATSIEELISFHLMPIFKGKESRFSASGREDIDVRTFGKGRPFVFEIIGPKRTIFSQDKLREVEKKVNSSTNLISIRDLQMVERKDVVILRTGEEEKSKSYSALCYTPGGTVTEEHMKILNSCSLPMVLYQKTPLRVLHRRSLATRERSILEMRAELIPQRKGELANDPSKSNLFKLFLRTQAGTYVKEFVHGDLGRTKPNISELLGIETDILLLDVMSVDLDWPPPLNYD